MRLVYDKSGITLHSGKRALVIARLQKLLQAMAASAASRAYLTRCRPTDPAAS